MHFNILNNTRYPGLWRKQATFDERKRIEAQGIISAQSTNNITLVKAQEIDDIIDGLDEKVMLFAHYVYTSCISKAYTALAFDVRFVYMCTVSLTIIYFSISTITRKSIRAHQRVLIIM